MVPAQEDSDLASEESNRDEPQYTAKQGDTNKTPPPADWRQTSRRAIPETHPDLTPASKAYIQNMLAEIKAFFTADTALWRKDMGVMTARLRMLEEAGDTTRGKQDDLKAEVGKLKQANLTMESRLAVLEDSKRQQNLRVRGVPEDAAEAEIPHYFRRLISSMLPQPKAKAIHLAYN
ncbi:Hypothetical predicted protein [Pelobates cultripes]|uniref:Uncharacterized protein n=1 Tax=Pelobates cultripes TaxID=61616 RepID=A0AAD1VQZ9_PELCU|nr:Hypothetical predicted protein [Pelobates cultripes]